MDSSRPSDHIDQEPPARPDGVTQPALGVVGYVRFFWRQLTSMRTALFLLLLLALAAVPGSLVPQTTSDPNGVLIDVIKPIPPTPEYEAMFSQPSA